MEKFGFRIDDNKVEAARSCLRLVVLLLLAVSTVLWVGGVISLVSFHLGFWRYPEWLSQITPLFPQDVPRIRLGEIGDILTGSLQPLALAWFVYAVLLQSRELRLQRMEFKELKKESKGSRQATEKQVTQLEIANTLANRELVRSIIHDSRPLVRRNAELSYAALSRLSRDNDGPSYSAPSGTDDVRKPWLHHLKRFLHPESHSGASLDFSLVWNDQSKLVGGGCRLRELIERMAEQYSDLKREAENADMFEYYDAFCMNSIEGEITKVSYALVEKMRRSDD